MSVSQLFTLMVAPARGVRGDGALSQCRESLVNLGQRPLVVGGDRALALIEPELKIALSELDCAYIPHGPDCSEASLQRIKQAIADHQADLVIGVGGGKALDTAKLAAHQNRLPVATIPTSAATCAAWTALSNVYSDEERFYMMWL